MENFKNTPDDLKFALLKELSNLPEDKKILDFLLNVAENEKYDKIRINTILLLRKYESDLVINKLKTIFAFEHDRSVRLSIIESLGNMNSKEIDDFFQNIVTKDLNDVVRGTIIRKLQERGNLDQNVMLELLLNIIQNDTSVFPIQIALNFLPLYAKLSTYNYVKNLFNKEEMFQMKKLLFRTLETISLKIKIDLDVNEPEEPIIEDTKKARRKRRKEQKKKKKGKDDYLYF